MDQTPWQVHKSWVIRSLLVLVITGLAEAAAGWYAVRPILWVVLIVSTLPASLAIFVAMPVLREENRKPR
jgi:hypothetical protein